MVLSAGKSPRFCLAVDCWLSFQDTNVVWPILRNYMTNTRKIHWENLNQRCLSSKLIVVDYLRFLLIDCLLRGGISPRVFFCLPVYHMYVCLFVCFQFVLSELVWTSRY